MHATPDSNTVPEWVNIAIRYLVVAVWVDAASFDAGDLETEGVHSIQGVIAAKSKEEAKRLAEAFVIDTLVNEHGALEPGDLRPGISFGEVRGLLADNGYFAKPPIVVAVTDLLEVKTDFNFFRET